MEHNPPPQWFSENNFLSIGAILLKFSEFFFIFILNMSEKSHEKLDKMLVFYCSLFPKTTECL